MMSFRNVRPGKERPATAADEGCVDWPRMLIEAVPPSPEAEEDVPPAPNNSSVGEGRTQSAGAPRSVSLKKRAPWLKHSRDFKVFSRYSI